MKISVGQKIKVRIEDYTQSFISRIWNGQKYVVKEVEVKEITYAPDWGTQIYVEIDGFLPKIFYKGELRNAMYAADPEPFNENLEEIVL